MAVLLSHPPSTILPSLFLQLLLLLPVTALAFHYPGFLLKPLPNPLTLFSLKKDKKMRSSSPSPASTELLVVRGPDDKTEEEDDGFEDSFTFSPRKAYDYVVETVTTTVKNPKLKAGIAWNDDLSVPTGEIDLQLRNVSLVKISVW